MEEIEIKPVNPASGMILVKKTKVEKDKEKQLVQQILDELEQQGRKTPEEDEDDFSIEELL